MKNRLYPLLMLVFYFSVPTPAQDIKQIFDPDKLLEGILMESVLQDASDEMEPILQNLSVHFQNDQEFLKILSQITFEGFGGFNGPYSIQTTQNGAIQFAISFFINTKVFAGYIASLRLMPNSKAKYYLDYWKQQVAEKFRTDIQLKGRYGELPSFCIYDIYNDSQLIRKMLDKYTKHINREILTWVVLHEIGHHKLKHDFRDTTSGQKSIKEETKADIWALQTMNEMGYPTDGVLKFIEIQAYIENQIYGSYVVEQTHPSWQRRSQTLSALILPVITPQWKILRVFAESQNVRSKGFFLSDFYISYFNKPSEFGMDVGIIMVDKLFQILSVDRKDPKNIKLYAYQSNDRPVMITISVIDSFFQELTFGFADESVFAHGKSYFDQFAHYQGLHIRENISAGEALRFSPDNFLWTSIQKATNVNYKQKGIESIVKNEIQQRNLAFSQFTKKLITQKQFETELLSQSKNSENKLRILLGNEGYDRWLNTLYGNQMFQFGLAAALTFKADTVISVFRRLKGNRDEVMAPKSVNLPVHFRSECKSSVENKEIKKLCRQYDMYNYDILDDTLCPGFRNSYTLKLKYPNDVVVDNSTSLMWQRGGSDRDLSITEAYIWINELNSKMYAGYSNWRLPTIEEALTLSEVEYYRNQLHIDPIFDDKQISMWTCDKNSEYSLGIDLVLGMKLLKTENETCYVRAVRSNR